MAKVYRLAMARASEVETPIEPAAVNRLIDAVETDSEITLSDEERQALLPSARQLIEELERLQREAQELV